MKLSELNLKNKKVVITGGANGLGKEFATAFSKHGSSIFLLDNDKDNLKKTAKNLKKNNKQIQYSYIDVSCSKSCEKVSKLIKDNFGNVNVLINNAAVYGNIKKSPFDHIKEAEWDKVMNINVKGVWQMCKFISPLMNSKEGGSIINISSATVFSGSTNWMHYVASKGAVISMRRVMARELGHKNIRVNVIAPGLILTEASKRLFSDAKNYGIQNASLLRNANSNEITGSALFLASHLAKFITGQTIIIDGGKQFI